jgi:hypothetical protein
MLETGRDRVRVGVESHSGSVVSAIVSLQIGLVPKVALGRLLESA